MTTEKQIAANRINGLKGGVKTEEGKAVSRLNAVTHGILSSEALLPGENEELLAELRESYMAELHPVGELETMLVETIITDTWRLKRVIRSEKKYSRSPSPDLTDKDSFIAGGDYRFSSYQNFIKYETSVKRSIIISMHELERLQDARIKGKLPSTLTSFLDSNTKGAFSETNPI